MKIEEGLPYAYRPLDPQRQRIHLRRRIFLRYFLIALVFIVLLVYAYFRWNSNAALSSHLNTKKGNWSMWLPRSWLPWKQDRSAFTDPLTDEINESTLIHDPQKQHSFTTIPFDSQPSLSDNSEDQPNIHVKPIAPHTRREVSWYETIKPYVPPDTLLMLTRMGLEQILNLFLTTVAPYFDMVIPRRHLKELEATLDKLNHNQLSVQDALTRSLIPIAMTTGVALLSLFPDIMSDVFDSLEEFFRILISWVNTADPTKLLYYLTDTTAETLGSLAGLSQASCKQASTRLHNYVYDLFRNNSAAHDPYAWLGALQQLPNWPPSWFPSWNFFKNETIQLAKDLASIKAQEALSSTLAQSFDSYLGGGSKKGSDGDAQNAAPNPLASIATQLFTSMLSQQMSSGGGKDKDDDSKNNPVSMLFNTFLHQNNNDDNED